MKEIVSLWITIRGFSLAVTWLETYKQSAEYQKDEEHKKKN